MTQDLMSFLAINTFIISIIMWADGLAGAVTP